MSYIFVEYKKEIFKNHQNCTLNFFFFLGYQQTIENVDEKILNNVIMFLNDCSNIVKNFILRTPRLYVLSDIDNILSLILEITANVVF